MQRLLFISVYCLLFCKLQAQLEGTNVFTNYQKKDGLLSNVVFGVVQDKDGFMWIGTDNGLQRYDGYRFLNFHHIPSDSASIPADIVQQFQVDKKGRLWIVSGKKIGIFNTSTFRYKDAGLKIADKILDKNIKKIFEDNQGRLMIFIGKDNLLTYNEEKNEFSSEYNFIHPPAGWVCEEILQDQRTGQYWITTKAGLMLYDDKTKTFSYRGNNPTQNPIIKQFENLDYTRRPYFDKTGRFWITRWIPFQGAPELYCFDPTNQKLSSFNPALSNLLKTYHEIWGMAEQKDGNFWIYGFQVFLYFNREKNEFQPVRNTAVKENDIRFDYVLQTYTDREDNLWISTNYGLFLFNPKSQLFVNTYNRRLNDTTVYKQSVSTIITTKNKDVWIGTLGTGLFTYDSKMNPLPNPFGEEKKDFSKIGIWNIAQRKNDEIWMGATNGNLIIFDGNNHLLADLYPPIFQKTAIRQVLEDSKGNMWLGSENGHIVKCINGNWRDSTQSFIQALKIQGRILKLIEDKSGNIWAATELFGVYKLDANSGKVLEHYDDKSGPGKQLVTNFTTDIMQYNDSLLFIANGNISVLNLKTNTISYFSTADGLPTNQISTFFMDQLGYVWIALSDGLCRLNVEKKVISTFDVKDGITEDNFETSSTSFLPDGRIAMGTLHDYLAFDARKIAKQNLLLDIKITDIKLAGKSLSVDSILQLQKLSLAYTDNNITIDYSALSYMQQNRIIYYHQLEGVDKDWVRSDYHQAVYTTLPPGKYAFKVRGVDGNGVSSNKVNELIITIAKPFWKTWWFYGTLILAAIGIFYLIDKERMRKLLALQEMRTQIAGNLHRELNSTLNNINLLSEMAKMKADKDLERSKEYIDQISYKTHRMIIAMDDMLWSIDPANDNMDKTISRMNEFTDALVNRNSVDIEMVVDEKVKTLVLDMKSRHEFFLIFKMALRIIVRQKQCKNIWITVDLVRPKLSLKIHDNETSIDLLDTETEKNMSEMRSRSKEINALLDVQSDMKGTSIILLVPVK